MNEILNASVLSMTSKISTQKYMLFILNNKNQLNDVLFKNKINGNYKKIVFCITVITPVVAVNAI